MMDLQVYLIIVTVFFVSLGSLLFINRQLRGGKTFEEALAEKRQLNEKLYGSKKKNASKKSNAGKKNRNKNSQDAKQQKQLVQQSIAESDDKSDSGSDNDGNMSSTSTASNELQAKAHVEFTEAEIIAPETNTVFKRQLSTGKMQPVRKTSTSKSPGSGILVNKSSVTPKPAPPTNGAIETLNNFDKIHPKDDLEIKKHRDESLGRTSNTSAAKKEHKKSAGKQAKKDNSPAAHTVEKKSNVSNDAVDAHLTIPMEVVANAVPSVPKESPKNHANKEKFNKKKRNDALLVQQLVDAGVASVASEAVNVNAIIQQLGRTELTRGEIQILIDFLLNKQQDTGNVTHSDWSDDPLHKLRKQIEDKNQLLAEEQKATLSLQNRLRELRAEFNAERSNAMHRQNAHIDEINTLKADLNQAQQDHQLFVERTNAEKKALNTQLQHLQQKLFQEKNSQTQENAQKVQLLTEAQAQLSAELLAKNNIIQDMQDKFLQYRDESLSKMSEYEQKLQEYSRQSEELSHLNGEIQRLRSDCQRKDEFEKLYARKKYEFEQLEACVAEQNKQSNQIEDNSKVEIRNLQNALDSSKTELTLSRNELADKTKRISELNTQLDDLKSTYDAENSNVIQKYSTQLEELNGTIQSYRLTISEKDTKLSELQTKLENASADQREQELFKQIADYKEKNNELRKKNWKLVDALQKAEESAYKISSKCKLVTTNTSLSPTKHSTSTQSNNNSENEEILRTKQVLERLFPNVPSDVDYNSWLTNLSSHIEQQQKHQQQSNQQNCLKQKSTIESNNHQNGEDDSDSEENITGNGTHHHKQDNGVKVSPSTEELVLQNAQLKSTVDEYKSIVADTEAVLNTLEKKVKEQDAYWRDVVQLKDNEIRSLQQNDVSST